MAKKKKHKKKHNNDSKYINSLNGILESSSKSKKDLQKEFKHALKDIERMQIELFEADKKQNRKNKKKINKKEKEFYTSMSSLKTRKKMCKEWEETGFLDKMFELLKEAAPIIKIIAKALCVLLITFLSVDAIKAKISPEALAKITKVFDFAMCI